MGKTTKFTQKQAEQKSLDVGIRMVDKYINARTKVKFECPFCKTIFKAQPTHIWGKDIRSCRCFQIQSTSLRSWQGTKDISQSHFGNIRYRAKKKNQKFTINIEYIQELLEKQNYKCALTDISINCGRSTYKQRSTYKEQFASLDRIDSSQGYIPGNVQWIHKDVNKMKQDLSEERFVELCAAVTKKSKKSLKKTA